MTHFELQGSKPQSLIAHGIAREYNLTGFSPQEFLTKHTGLDFNYNALQIEFKKHCPDYMDDIALDKKSIAVEFASKIIYEVGPESRNVKRGTGDKVWRFTFPLPEASKGHKHVVFVATYKQEGAEYKTENSTYSMTLTLKQAALLVHETLTRLVNLGVKKDMKLLTPLAGACFSKDDIVELSTKLNMSVPELLVAINQSTQGGGQYLKKSDIDIAICASIAATRNVKDENLKKSIVVKVVKQYMAKGFTPNKARIEIISGYATGGIPSEFSYEELIKIFDV